MRSQRPSPRTATSAQQRAYEPEFCIRRARTGSPPRVVTQCSQSIPEGGGGGRSSVWGRRDAPRQRSNVWRSPSVGLGGRCARTLHAARCVRRRRRDPSPVGRAGSRARAGVGDRHVLPRRRPHDVPKPWAPLKFSRERHDDGTISSFFNHHHEGGQNLPMQAVSCITSAARDERQAIHIRHTSAYKFAICIPSQFLSCLPGRAP